jgi:hypothetical protein
MDLPCAYCKSVVAECNRYSVTFPHFPTNGRVVNMTDSQIPCVGMAGSMVGEDKRRQIVADWLDCGNYNEVARRHNLTEGAIRRQRKDSSWWPEIEEELLQGISDSARIRLSARANYAIDLIGERLREGDPYVLKDGTVRYAPVRTRDLVLTLGIMFDKLRLLEGKPTKLTAALNLNDLADQFRDIAKGRSNVVSVQGPGGASEGSEAG